MVNVRDKQVGDMREHKLVRQKVRIPSLDDHKVMKQIPGPKLTAARRADLFDSV